MTNRQREPKSIKICQKLTSASVTRVRIMITENARTITGVKNPDSWNLQKSQFPRQTSSKFTSKDVTQPFKRINWVSIMMPENTRPITGVKIEISWNQATIQNLGATMASQKCPGVFLCQTVRPNNLGIELLSKNPFQKCIFFLISISFTMWKSNYVPKNTSAHIFPVDPQIA